MGAEAVRGEVVAAQESLRRLDESAALIGRHGGKGRFQQFDRQHITLAFEELTSASRQPHESAAPVGRIVLPLEEARTFEVRDDLADHRLRSVQMAGQLADGYRPRQGEVLQHRLGRSRPDCLPSRRWKHRYTAGNKRANRSAAS